MTHCRPRSGWRWAILSVLLAVTQGLVPRPALATERPVTLGTGSDTLYATLSRPDAAPPTRRAAAAAVHDSQHFQLLQLGKVFEERRQHGGAVHEVVAGQRAAARAEGGGEGSVRRCGRHTTSCLRGVGAPSNLNSRS